VDGRYHLVQTVFRQSLNVLFSPESADQTFLVIRVFIAPLAALQITPLQATALDLFDQVEYLKAANQY
jgi:hypothetical protein